MLHKFIFGRHTQVQEIKPCQTKNKRSNRFLLSKTKYFYEHGIPTNIQLQNLIFTETYSGRSILQHGRQYDSCKLRRKISSKEYVLPKMQLQAAYNLRFITLISTDSFLPSMKVTPRYLKVDDHEIQLEPNYISEMLCAAPWPMTVLVDFAQLNCKRNSVLVEKQQFNIACSPFTVADIKIRSSAYIRQPL